MTTGYFATPQARKLGIKPGQRIQFDRAPPRWQLEEPPEDLADAGPTCPADLIVSFFTTANDLPVRLPALAHRIRRGEHNRLGFAVQIGTVRFLGTFLADPSDVPWEVAAHLAGQLGIADPGVLKQYAAREGTNRLHAGEVLLPGPTVLARLIASVRDQAATRLWEVVAAVPDPGQRARLEDLLVVPAGERSSTLDRLRRGPTSVTATGLLGALHRLEEIDPPAPPTDSRPPVVRPGAGSPSASVSTSPSAKPSSPCPRGRGARLTTSTAKRGRARGSLN